MASACINNIGVPPENFPPASTCSSYGWLSSRISLSREDEASKSKPGADPSSGSDPTELSDSGDFEFRLGEDPVVMLPADELFADGKLMPLQLSSTVSETTDIASCKASPPEIRSPETAKSISGTDPYLFSPKAPRCSSRWREFLGLKKLSQNQTQSTKAESQKTTSFLSSNANSSTAKSLKLLLHRSSKSASNVPMSASLDASLSLPLLKDTDSESVSISSSRLSLSSSSSSHDHEDLPRLSLDSDKPSPSPNPFLRNPNTNPPRMRLGKARTDNGPHNNNGAVHSGRAGRSPMKRPVTTSGESGRGVSVDSPRMNSSGKVVFQSLERSSSSPSTFNGGPRFKHRGMERSYSANLRVTPVLNVPVCTLRGFGQLFSSSPQKRDGNGGGGGSGGCSIKVQPHSRNRISDRT